MDSNDLGPQVDGLLDEHLPGSAGWLLLVWAGFLWLFQERLSAEHGGQGSMMGKNTSN